MKKANVIKKQEVNSSVAGLMSCMNREEKKRIQDAMEIVKSFPVTKNMFPSHPVQTWQAWTK